MTTQKVTNYNKMLNLPAPVHFKSKEFAGGWANSKAVQNKTAHFDLAAVKMMLNSYAPLMFFPA